MKTKKRILSAVAMFVGILALGACGPGERNETDYVNEIEAEETSPGQPYLEEQNEVPAEVEDEMEQDTLSPNQEPLDPEPREERIQE